MVSPFAVNTVMLTQPSKAFARSVVTESGSETDVRPVQPENADAPIS